MTEYTLTVKAVQWFKLGDHPAVYSQYMDSKGNPWYQLNDNSHGWLRHPTVRPGNYIVEFPNGRIFRMGKRHFESLYKKVTPKKKRG